MDNTEDKKPLTLQKWRVIPDTKERSFMVTSSNLEDFILTDPKKARELCELLNALQRKFKEEHDQSEANEQCWTEAASAYKEQRERNKELSTHIKSLESEVERLKEENKRMNTFNTGQVLAREELKQKVKSLESKNAQLVEALRECIMYCHDDTATERFKKALSQNNPTVNTHENK
jgi:chromosome segregation ATPase